MSIFVGAPDDRPPSETATFLFYDAEVTSVFLVTVDGERAVQITGTGFANTAMVVCRLKVDTLGSFAPRVFLDTTSVRCSVVDTLATSSTSPGTSCCL